MCALVTFLVLTTKDPTEQVRERWRGSFWLIPFFLRLQTIIDFRRVSLLFFYKYFSLFVCLRWFVYWCEWVLNSPTIIVLGEVSVCSQGLHMYVLNCIDFLMACSLNQYEVDFFTSRGDEYVHVYWCTCVCRYICVHIRTHVEAKS